MLEYIYDTGKIRNGLVKQGVELLIGPIETPLYPMRRMIQFLHWHRLWIEPSNYKQDLLLGGISLLPQILNMISLITNLYLNIYNPKAAIENLSYTMVSITGFYLAVVFMLNSHKYRELCDEMMVLNHQYDIGDDSVHVEKLIRFGGTAFLLYCMAGAGVYCTSPYFTRDFCTESGAVICGLPTAGSFPYNASKSPMYEVTYLFHTFCAFETVYTCAVVLAFVCLLMMHVTAHLEYLKLNVLQICNTPDRHERLVEFIHHHAAVLRFGQKADVYFYPVMILQSAAMSVIISVLLIQIAMMTLKSNSNGFDVNVIRYVMHMCGWICQLLVECTLGQYLTDSSANIAYIIYDIPWYEESVEFQRRVRTIIMRSHKPLLLTVASVDVIGRELFMGVMKSAYSLFTLLFNFLDQ